MKQLAKGFGFGMLMVAGLLAAAPTTNAADERVTDGPEVLVVPMQQPGDGEWGIASTSVLTIPAFTFQALDDSVQSPAGYNRFSPSGMEVEAAVMLPAGALITAIELQGCDTNATGEVVFVLGRVASNGGATPLSALGATGLAGTPGCGKFPLTVASVQVNNTETYIVAVRSGTTSTTSYTAMRVFYRLQVSPAPAVATFPNDVPTTHPNFQFIEALAASGITSGCAPSSYCPDSPLTRQQMAVFLARAFGLHFVP